MSIKKISKDELLEFLKKEKESIKVKFGIEIIALFGSMARGDYTDKSDVDILHRVVAEKKYDPFKIENFFKKHINRKVDLVSQKWINPAVEFMSKNERIYV